MNPVNSIELQQIPSHLRWRHVELQKINSLNPSLEDVKKSLFFFSTIHLYSSRPLPPSQKNIVVVTGLVFDDGVGDYYHILNVAEYIKSKFPMLEVTMVVGHMVGNLAAGVKMPSNAHIETHFFQHQHTPDNVYEILKKADHILEVSQKSQDREIAKITKDKQDRYKFIAEYGFCPTHESMGIKYNHLGIIIKDIPPASSLLDLRNVSLKEFLLGSKTPSRRDLESYVKTHEIFIAYLKTGSYYQTGFIYTAAALSKFSTKQTLDLIIPQVNLNCLHTEFLKQQGIATIKILRIQEDPVIPEEITLSEKGKELRLINPFPLEQTDFHTLLTCTHRLVGCTGDHSFTEAVSFDRIPFYELRSAKTSFINHLIILAERVGEHPFYLKQYFKELSSIYDNVQAVIISCMAIYDKLPDEASKLEHKERKKIKFEHLEEKQPEIAESALKIAELLKQPKFVEEVQKLNSFLRENFSFNAVLQNIVERDLALAHCEDLRKLEGTIREDYLEDRITLNQVVELLKESIQNGTL